jgi:hypothetical protein
VGTLLGKPLQFVATSAFVEEYPPMERILYANTAVRILQKHPVDMLVFEMSDKNHYQVRLAGYHFQTNELDETSVVFKVKSLKIKTFWLRIDDDGEHYIGTFLFPEDY